MSTQISPALEAFMGGLIDYAGMFPPASLNLATTLANHERYRAGEDRAMLGRCIVKAGDLAQIHAEQIIAAGPLPFSVLATGGKTALEVIANTVLDVDDRIRPFNGRHHDRVVVDVMEFRIPEEDTAPVQVEFLARRVAKILDQGIRCYFEISGSAKDLSGEKIAAAIAGLTSAHSTYPTVGFKLRTGGTTPEAFPSVSQVAFAIDTARINKLPIKFTAGLHHPLRHRDDTMGVLMHGFVNVLGASVMAHALSLDRATLIAMLSDENPTHFVFGDDLTWIPDGIRVSAAQIREAREKFAISFGSCSFDEPREDLRKLGLLP